MKKMSTFGIGDFYGAVFDRCTDVEIDVLLHYIGKFEGEVEIIPEEHLEAAKAKFMEHVPPYIEWLRPYLEGLPVEEWTDFTEGMSHSSLDETFDREERAFEAHLRENCPPEQELAFWSD